MSDETVVVVTDGNDETETPEEIITEVVEEIAEVIQEEVHTEVERELSERVKELEVRSERFVDRDELGWLDERISEAVRLSYETRQEVLEVIEEVVTEPEETEVVEEIIPPTDDTPPKRKHWFFGEK